MWSTPKFLKEFGAACDTMLATVTAKNHDYAGDTDPFYNFRMIELLSQGDITAEQGIMVRLTDKYARLMNLLARPAHVTDESFWDTCRDLAAYGVILGLLRRAETEPDETVAPTEPGPDVQPPPPVSYFDQLKAILGRAASGGIDVGPAS